MSALEKADGATVPQQKIICITAAQRAGTTALQHALAATGAIKNYGEIFQTRESRSGDPPHHCFLEFVKRNDIRLANVLTRQGASNIATRYVDELKQEAFPKHVLIDVKLNSWFALSPSWGYPHEPPFFLRHLKRQAAIFIFIWRRSLADQVLSGFISREIGVWQNLEAENVGGKRFVAPIKKLTKLAAQICRSEEDMREHLTDYPHMIEVAYEDLFVNGDITQEFRLALNSAIGGDLRFTGTGGIQHSQGSKAEIIVNYRKSMEKIGRVAEEHRAKSGEAGGTQ